MKRITCADLKNIKNSQLASYARVYADMEAKFHQIVLDNGLGIGDYKPNIELRKAVSTASVNSARSYCTGEMSEACRNCKTGEGATTFVLTLACNRDCYFCTNKNQQDYKELQTSYNDVVGEFDIFAKGQTVRSVALTGGEPLLLPDVCEEFYSHVKQHDPSIHTRMYTNGDLITPEIMDRLTPFLDEIRIGIKWEEDETINLEKAQEVLALCSNYDLDTVIEMPVLPQGYDHMLSLIKLADQTGVKSINILEYLFAWNHAEDYAEKRL